MPQNSLNAISEIGSKQFFSSQPRCIEVYKVAQSIEAHEWSVTANVIFITNLEDNEPLTVDEKLKEIKNILGLSVVDLASILNTQRQTIYNWLNGGVINQKSSERLDDILKVVQMWKDTEMGEFPPAKLMAQTLRTLPSMLKVLSEETIDFDIVPQCIKSLVELVKAQKLKMDTKLDKLAQRSQQMSSKDYEKLGEFLDAEERDLPRLREIMSKKSPWK